MEMHECSRCHLRKPETDFHKKKGRIKGIQDICKGCRQDYQKEWYKNNKPAQIKAASERRDAVARINQALVIKYLQEHPCVDCGEKDIVVLQFDHVRGEKEYDISRMIRNFPWHRILTELEKCDVRCANDHVRRTSKIQKSYRCALVV